MREENIKNYFAYQINVNKEQVAIPERTSY